MARETEENLSFAIALPLIVLVGAGVALAIMFLKEKKVVASSHISSEVKKVVALPKVITKELLTPLVVEKARQVEKSASIPSATKLTFVSKPKLGETKEQYIERQTKLFQGESTRTAPVLYAEAKKRAENAWETMKKLGIK